MSEPNETSKTYIGPVHISDVMRNGKQLSNRDVYVKINDEGNYIQIDNLIHTTNTSDSQGIGYEYFEFTANNNRYSIPTTQSTNTDPLYTDISSNNTKITFYYIMKPLFSRISRLFKKSGGTKRTKKNSRKSRRKNRKIRRQK